MSFRPRLRRISKWTASALSLGLFATWLLASYSTTSVGITPGATRPHQAVFSHGCVEWLVAQPSGSSNLIGCFKLKSEVGPTFDAGLYLPRVESSQLPGIARCIIIPLWLPLALTLVATSILWSLDRRRPQHGCCVNCNYDLTGNVSGRCPECGEPIVEPAA